MKQRIDQHSDQITGLEKAEALLTQRLEQTEKHYEHLHQCLHSFRGETRGAFANVHNAMHDLEGRIKDQLHETDTKWNDRLINVEAKKVEVKPTPAPQGKPDESLVTLRDVIWFAVMVSAILVTAFVK